MHIVAHVDRPDHVCCRYRVRAFEPAFAAAGHSLSFESPRPVWHDVLRRPRQHADLAVLQRRLPNHFELNAIRNHSKSLVFDFDDAVWLRDSYAERGPHSSKRLHRFRNVLCRADHVIAGNDFLAVQARRYARAAPITVVPTCVDPLRYAVAVHRDSAPIDLVWIGSSSTLQGLERLRPLLERLGRSFPFLRLKLICDRSLKLDRLPVEAVTWSAHREAAALATSAIGIAWMPDDDWSRGKCGLKVLQYMAAGLPVVANPIGVHAEIIRHGQTGYLVATDDDWMQAVHALAASAAKRRQFGLEGRRLVEQKYSVASGVRLWLNVLGSLATQRKAA